MQSEEEIEFSSSRTSAAVANWEAAEQVKVADVSEVPGAWQHGIERLSDKIAQLDYALGECLSTLDAAEEPAEHPRNMEPADPPGLAQIGTDLGQALAHIDSLMAADTASAKQMAHVQGQLQEVQSLMNAVQDRLSAPPPEPDLAPQQALLSRFVSVMEQLGQRQQAATSDFEGRLDTLGAQFDTHIGAVSQASEDMRAMQGATAQSVVHLERSLEDMRAQLKEHVTALDPEAITAAVMGGLEESWSSKQAASLEAAFNVLQQTHLAPFEATLQRVEERLSMPPPAMDLAPQRALLSGFVTAMEHVARRQEATATALEARLEAMGARFDDHVAKMSNAGDQMQTAHAATAQSVVALEQTVEALRSEFDVRVSEAETRLQPVKDAFHLIQERLAAPLPTPDLNPLEQVVQRVEDRLAAPPPTLDLAPQRALLARFVTAMEHVGQRQKAVATDVEGLVDALNPTAITAAVLSGLEEARKATPEVQEASGSDIAEHLLRGFRLAVAEAVARASRDVIDDPKSRDKSLPKIK